MKYNEKTFEYVPEWKGPVADRSSTDLPALAVFGVLMTCWLGVGCYAVIHGNPEAFFNVQHNETQKEEILNTIVSTRTTVLGLIAGGAVFSMIYICLLKWLALQFLFLSTFSWLSFACFLVYYHYKYYEDGRDNRVFASSMICFALTGLIVLLVVCFWKKIQTACRLIEVTSEAVTSMVSTFFFAILVWLLHLTAVVYAVVIGLYLYTIGNGMSTALIIVHVVGYVWLYSFITALGEMILAGTFATWYWTFRKSDVPLFAMATSAWRTMRYHLGTVAFGSVLITICHLIRYVLSAVLYLREQDGIWRTLTHLVVHCMLNVLAGIETFVRFMNRNAYIMCAVYGKGLCSSASDAMSLVLRNELEIFVLNNVVTCLLWLGRISISAFMALIAWFHYTSTNYEIDNWWVPVIVVVVGTHLVTAAFFSLYEIAVDTIYLCFLEDCERNDGSQYKPYYMSHQLREVLHNDMGPRSVYIRTLPIYP